MKTTTLNKIREHSPSPYSWDKLLKHLGKTEADDEPLPFSVILESNGLEEAIWCCRTAPEYDKDWRLFAVWCAEHLMPDSGAAAAAAVAAAATVAAAEAAAVAAAATVAAAEAAVAAAATVVAAAEAAAAEAQTKKFLEIVGE